jgi:hypothetical protein
MAVDQLHIIGGAADVNGGVRDLALLHARFGLAAGAVCHRTGAS